MPSLLSDIKKYNRRLLMSDLFAGLTLGIVLIPQGMAHAILAGMPPIYGLYTAIIPLLIYPLFASSRHLNVGPVALMSIIVFSAFSSVAEPASTQYIQLVLLAGFFSGVFQIVFGLFKLGVLSNFLSKPVMNAFIAAAAIVIIISQIKPLLSLPISNTGQSLEVLIRSIFNIGKFNLFSLILGTGGLFLIIAFRKIHPLIPSFLIVVVVSMLATYWLHLDQAGVPIIGEIPKGLPQFSYDFFSLSSVMTVLPASFVISMICFVGSYSIAQSIASSTDYTVDANKELIGLGFAKLFGSFFMAIPATGSFSRSFIAKQAGAKTGLNSIFAALFLMMVLLMFTHLFYYLPKPILAAIIISSVYRLIDLRYAKRLLEEDTIDFWIWVATFLFTILIGIVPGIIAGVGFSLLSLIIRSRKQKFVELGRLPDTQIYRNVKRYPHVELLKEVLILRYDQNLYFNNTGFFCQEILERVESRGAKKLILHLGSVHNMDSTAIDKFANLIDTLIELPVEICFTNLSGNIRDKFHQSGIYDKLGHKSFHLSVAHAVLGPNLSDTIEKDLSNKYAAQTNYIVPKRK